MNLDQLQQQWAAYDSKLDSVLKLNQQMVRQLTLGKARQSLVWHKLFIVAEAGLGIWITGLLADFTMKHWGDWHFAVPGLLLALWTIGGTAFVTSQLIQLLLMDYDAPVIALQRQIEARRVARIRFTQWALLTGSVLWVLWVVVALKGIWNVNLYAGAGAAFVAINLMLGALIVAAFILFTRLNAARIRRSPFMRHLIDSLAGTSLTVAAAHLEDLARFEQDRVMPAGVPATPRSVPTGTQSLSRMQVLVLFGIPLLVLFWVGLALWLVHSPAPQFTRVVPALETPVTRPDNGQCNAAGALHCITMRDGLPLAATHYPGKAKLSIVLAHNLLTDSRSLETSAKLLNEATGADVWNVDLRGHGRSGGRTGDVDYTGQYEHDLADLIANIRKAQPEHKVILAGHSMGGGIAARYAQLAKAPTVDGYLLFAPNLGHTSPTARHATEPGSKPDAEPLFLVHTRRIFGLLILDGVGIKTWSDLPTLFFNAPQGYWIDRYSFRAMRNISPEDYKAALTADDKPMLVLVGSEDKVFMPKEYPAVISLHRNGSTVIVPGATHTSVTRSAEAMTAIRNWIASLAR